MNIIKAIDRGIEAAQQTFQPRKYSAAGKPVHCTHCGGDVFEVPRGAMGTFSGYALQCSQCGLFMCFGKEPAVMP